MTAGHDKESAMIRAFVITATVTASTFLAGHASAAASRTALPARTTVPACPGYAYRPSVLDLGCNGDSPVAAVRSWKDWKVNRAVTFHATVTVEVCSPTCATGHPVTRQARIELGQVEHHHFTTATVRWDGTPPKGYTRTLTVPMVNA